MFYFLFLMLLFPIHVICKCKISTASEIGKCSKSSKIGEVHFGYTFIIRAVHTNKKYHEIIRRRCTLCLCVLIGSSFECMLTFIDISARDSTSIEFGKKKLFPIQYFTFALLSIEARKLRFLLSTFICLFN